MSSALSSKVMSQPMKASGVATGILASRLPSSCSTTLLSAGKAAFGQPSDFLIEAHPGDHVALPRFPRRIGHGLGDPKPLRRPERPGGLCRLEPVGPVDAERLHEFGLVRSGPTTYQ